MSFGGPFGGVPGGMWHPQTMSKYLSVEYLLISIKTSALAEAAQEIDFLGPHFGRFSVELPQKILGEIIAFAAQQLYTKIRFRCCVV